MQLRTLFVGLLCGTVGVLVDIDHVISYYIGWNDHFLHTPLLIISGAVLCCLIAYLGGLLYRSILKRKGVKRNA